MTYSQPYQCSACEKKTKRSELTKKSVFTGILKLFLEIKLKVDRYLSIFVANKKD